MLKRLKIIFIFAAAVFGFAFSQGRAKAAVLYSGSAYQVVHQGDTFTIDWFLDSQNESINALDFKLNFDKDILQGVSANNGNSSFSIWIKNPQFDNSKGTLSLTAGAPNGINNSSILIFHSVFKAIKAGTAQISLDPASVLFKNDSKATKANLKFAALSFIVAPGELLPAVHVYSPTDPDQNAWYKSHDVSINFDPRPGEVYSYSFSSNLEVYPEDQTSSGNSANYKNIPDGIYYFKLNSKVGPSIWRETAVFRVQIDSTPPEGFKVAISQDPKLFDGKQFAIFNAVDKTSGILHYKIKSGLTASKDAQNPQQISRPIIGGSIQVLALDNAGNARAESINYPPYISTNIIVGISIIILAAALFFIRKQIINRKLIKSGKNEE